MSRVTRRSTKVEPADRRRESAPRVSRTEDDSKTQSTAQPANTFLLLQRSIGNRAVSRIAASLFPGVRRSSPAVANAASPGSRIQRQDQAAEGPPQTDAEARAAFEQGRAAHDSGNYEAALHHFEAAIAAPGLDPSRMPDLVWNMALARARLGDTDGAMTDAMTYGQYSPDPPQSELLQRIHMILNEGAGGAEAEAAASGGGAPQTDEEARAAFEQGRAAHDSGNYEAALRHYEAATAAPGLDPSRMPDLVWNMALARARLGDADGAMTDAMTYGQYSPDPPQSELLQRIHMILNQGAEAEEAGAGGGAPQTNEEARAAYEQGRADYAAGNFEAALRKFEAAAQAPGLDSSRMPGLLWNMAHARARMGDIENAMTDAATYGQYRPNEALVESIRTVVYGPEEEAAGEAE